MPSPLPNSTSTCVGCDWRITISILPSLFTSAASACTDTKLGSRKVSVGSLKFTAPWLKKIETMLPWTSRPGQVSVAIEIGDGRILLGLRQDALRKWLG